MAKLAQGVIELPAFPHVVIKVQEVLQNPHYTAQMLSRPISTDPMLAARLLNMANSNAFNATGRVIIDLGVALTRLGAQKVYSVVIAHAIQHVRRTEALRSIARPLDELWSESVAVAHFCDAVAKRTSFPAQDAFVAGLLHRIGHFYILAQCVERGPAQPRVVLNNDVVDSWAPTIAGAVLKIWQISDPVCEAVATQADVAVGRTGPPNLSDVLLAGIRLSKRLSQFQDMGSLSSGGVLARLNLSIETCQSLIAEAAVEIKALARALHP